MPDKPIYIAAYHQSPFGKLKTLTVPEIVQRSIEGACDEIDADPAAIDVGSIGAACGFTLNDQGLLAGLMAMVPGLAGKPIESVENACASGGQAILSVTHKLLLGLGEVGIAVGYEKMRNDEGKMDGKLVGRALGVFSHPDEREGKAAFGEGARYWKDGKAAVDGDCAVNTSGGLIAKGHPIGATGVAMVGWSAKQLLGTAPEELQRPNPTLAATFNIGGPICASVCTVLKPAM